MELFSFCKSQNIPSHSQIRPTQFFLLPLRHGLVLEVGGEPDDACPGCGHDPDPASSPLHHLPPVAEDLQLRAPGRKLQGREEDEEEGVGGDGHHQEGNKGGEESKVQVSALPDFNDNDLIDDLFLLPLDLPFVYNGFFRFDDNDHFACRYRSSVRDESYYMSKKQAISCTPYV